MRLSEIIRLLHSRTPHDILISGKIYPPVLTLLEDNLKRANNTFNICFSHNELAPQQWLRLAPALSRFKHIKIENNALSVDTISAILKACHDGKVESLSLRGCGIDDAQLRHLSTFLTILSCQLKHLDIRENPLISAAGLKNLSESLKDNLSLSRLELTPITGCDAQIQSIQERVAANLDRQQRQAERIRTSNFSATLYAYAEVATSPDATTQPRLSARL